MYAKEPPFGTNQKMSVGLAARLAQQRLPIHTNLSTIGVWTADVKNRDGSSSNREEDAITSDDQMPNGNTQLFALGRERTSHGQ